MILRYGNEDEEKNRMQFLAYYILFLLSISSIALVILLFKAIIF